MKPIETVQSVPMAVTFMHGAVETTVNLFHVPVACQSASGINVHATAIRYPGTGCTYYCSQHFCDHSFLESVLRSVFEEAAGLPAAQIADEDYGFFLNDGEFVSRDVAKNIAIAAGQIPSDFNGELQGSTFGGD